MDIGFLILIIAVSVPFFILAFGLSWQRKKQRSAQLDNLYRRVGLEPLEQKKIESGIGEYARSVPYLFLVGWLKKAGIYGKKNLLRLLAAQVVLLIFSSYMIATRLGSIDTKLLVLVVVLPLLPAAYVVFTLHKRQNRMKKQFPEMLDALARALYSGYGVDGGLNMIAEEFPQPLGQEMKEVTRQLSLGINMREILREFQSRVTLQEAQFFVVTLIIQRETGGQLAAILTELSRLMRRREMFQAKLKTLTAESRFTALFIGGAPMVYLAYKYLFDYDSLAFFLNDPVGQKMFVVSLVLMATGTLILRTMLRLKF
ncbi:MAG: type II secretion system F family protein [Hydrogenovibrio sp.]|nr:type II secretion system F family protein [Hydrogenovibrio sp.]